MDGNRSNSRSKIQEEKASVITALLMGGCLILFFSATISQNLSPEARTATLWGFVIGAICIIAGLSFVKSENAYQWFRNKLTRPANWLNVRPVQIPLLMMSPLFAILTINASGFGARMHSPFAAIATWILGIACAICGGWQWTDTKIQISKTTFFWFAFVTILSFLLRALATGQIPILLNGDEGSAGINAAEFANGEMNNIFITSWFSFPSLFPFIESLSIRIFGQTTEALRLPSALAGALTVGAVYVCGKEMFGQRAGLLGALFLSTLHFHIHFSRLGINNIWDGLGFIISMGALWYAWKNDHRGAYVLAGLALGFSQYFYSSGRALILVIFILVILILLFQRARIREALPHFLMTFMTATVVIAPLAWFYINEPHQFIAPMARVSILKGDLSIQSLLSNLSAWKVLFHQLAIGMQAYTYTPLLFWYAPDVPMLRPIAVVLFYIGSLYLIIESRDGRLVLLSLWLMAFGMIGGLSDSAPASQRYVASAPACALIVGYGLHKFGSTLENLWHRSARVITVMVFIFLGMTMVSDLYFYFIEYTSLSRIDNMNSNGMIAQELANYLKDKPPDVTVAFLGTSNMGYYSIPGKAIDFDVLFKTCRGSIPVDALQL